MIVSIWGILLAAFAIGLVVRFARRSIGAVMLLVVAALVVVWLAAARSTSVRVVSMQGDGQQQMVQQWDDVQQNVAFAQRQAASQIQLAQQQSAQAVQNVKMQLRSDASFKQKLGLQGSPNITVPSVQVPSIQLPTPPMITMTSPTVPAPVATFAGGERATWIVILPIILIPALVALAALTAARRGRGQSGSGMGWVVAGVGTLVLLGFLFTGVQRTGTVIAPLEQVGVPLDNSLQAAADAASRESIDSIWERLSAPQIKLELEQAGMTPDQVTAAQAKLNEAAMVLQTAAETMTDSSSSSQSWLVVMAEALLKATAKNPPAPAEAAVPAVPAAPVKVLQPATQPHEKPRVVLGKRTPDWVVHPPGIVGNVRKFVVHAGPYKTLEECHRELEIKMGNVVESRVNELAGTAAGGSKLYPNLFQLGVGTDYILRELCTEEFVETKEFAFGDMLTAHALMEFTPAQDAVLKDHWTAYARQAGVARTAAGAGLVVGCLALVFGLLKLDTWTRGYYTKRLFLGVPAAIIVAATLMNVFGWR